jgi:hypothetical protein
MTILNNFLKTYTDRKYQYTAQINHKGTVRFSWTKSDN